MTTSTKTYENLCGSLWKLMKTSGNLCKHMKTYENLWNVWKRMKTYENLWKPMRTYENLWNPMKPIENQRKINKLVCALFLAFPRGGGVLASWLSLLSGLIVAWLCDWLAGWLSAAEQRITNRRGKNMDITRYGRWLNKSISFSLYGFWEGLLWCKILPPDVGTICPYFW